MTREKEDKEAKGDKQKSKSRISDKETCFAILQPHGIWWAIETELGHEEDEEAT